MTGTRRFLYDNGVSIAFGLLFIAALVGQAIAGWADFNNDQLRHHAADVTFWRYVTSSHFGAAVTENWQSEYLQFTLFIFITIWLIQRGSPESKEPRQEGLESDEQQTLGEHAHEGSPLWARVGGARTFLYSNSLLIVMLAIWIGSWVAQSFTGLTEYNSTRIGHQEDPLSWWSYLGTADFWEKTLQNWQSEFLAVGSMAILAVYLRQRGSPESKPVGAAHTDTGVEG
ncbi:MAG: DUF6766 family protein [Nocardioidaceae bacterium]